MEPDPQHPAETPDPPAPARAQRSPLARLSTALNTGALLSTTAVLVAIDPKIPPYRAD